MYHHWTWRGQEERFYFNDRDKPHAVDVWECDQCGKRIVTRGDRNPNRGRCSAGESRSPSRVHVRIRS